VPVCIRTSEFVEQRHIFFDLVRVAVEKLAFVHRTVRTALSRSAIVSAVQDQRVIELSRFFQVLDNSAHLNVRIFRKASVDFRHSAKEFLFVSRQGIPRTHRIRRCKAALRHRVNRCEFGAFWKNPLRNHARQDPSAVGFVAVVEFTLVLVDVFLRRMMGRMIRAGIKPEIPRLMWFGLLRISNKAQRLVSQVFGKVVAILRSVRLVDKVVVLDQIREPVVSLATHETVETVIALTEWPVLF